MAVLPIMRADVAISRDDNGIAGMRIASLKHWKRNRWRIVSQLCDQYKESSDTLDALGRIDFRDDLSAQVRWGNHPGNRPVCVVYTSSGEPAAESIYDDDVIVYYELFGISCRASLEANYSTSIIDGRFLARAVNKYTIPNWAGKTRGLQKQLWKLPIPYFDSTTKLHLPILEAGEALDAGALRKFRAQQEDRGDAGVTWSVARSELRKWLS